jgi:hypothetical protein
VSPRIRPWLLGERRRRIADRNANDLASFKIMSLFKNAVGLGELRYGPVHNAVYVRGCHSTQQRRVYKVVDSAANHVVGDTAPDQSRIMWRALVKSTVDDVAPQYAPDRTTR